MNSHHQGVPRRMVLAAGAALLLPGCASAPRRTSALQASPVARTGRAWSMPADLPTSGLSAPGAAVPSRCPTHAAAVPGSPMYFLPCSGTSIALTLDDGPSTQWTARMLALLDHYQIPATFSLIGRQAAAHPTLVGEIVAAGHTIANHTWSHPDLAVLPQATIEREIIKAGDAIEHAAGRRPILFRAPGGAWSRSVLALCAREGLTPLDWSIDPRDWSRPGTHRIADVILRNVRPGSIILEHDGGGDRQQTYEALSLAVPRLLDAGYTFVTP